MTMLRPEGWALVELGEVLHSSNSGVSVGGELRPRAIGEHAVLRTSCVATGIFRQDAYKVVTGADRARLDEPLQGDSIIVSRANTPELVGASAYVEHGDPALFLSDKLWQLRANARAIPRFLSYCLASETMRERSRALATGSSASMRNISKESFLALPVPLPPLDEQRRIVAALTAWDRALETAAALLASKRRLYAAARQRLIDDHQRSASGNDGWQNAEFGGLAEELSERNRGRLGASSVMGVLKSQGIVPMREHVMASDLDRYLVVPPGAFAYNPMRLNIGSIAQSAHSSDVLVSPDYVVFSARVGAGSAAFLRHFIGSKRWRDTMELAASGSVRLRIYFEGLAEMTLRTPSLRQQERIAMVLDAAQAEIALANKKLESLRAQKRGLMQKLLTGEWRLPATASEQAA